MDRDSYFVFNPKDSRSKIYVKIYNGFVSILNLETHFSSSDSMVGPGRAVLLQIRSVRILDTIVCSGILLWLFSPALDAVKLTLQVGFIFPFVVIDHADLGATIVVAQALSLTFFNLSPTQKTYLFTVGNKASVCEGSSRRLPSETFKHLLPCLTFTSLLGETVAAVSLPGQFGRVATLPLTT